MDEHLDARARAFGTTPTSVPMRALLGRGLGWPPIHQPSPAPLLRRQVLSSCIFGLVVDRHSAVGIGLVALASTAYNVPPQCTWAALAWFGALLPRGPESNIAYARVRVAERAEDEHRVRALHVHLEVANLLEVVDVEEDAQLGDHLAQSLLDDAHLVLAGAPHVREEEVEVEWPRDEGRAHLWVSGREGCGSAVHEKGRISPCET